MTEFFAILTVQKPTPSGIAQTTITRLVPVGESATATGLYGWMCAQLPEHVRENAVTVFYSATPNALNGLPAPAGEDAGGASS